MKCEDICGDGKVLKRNYDNYCDDGDNDSGNGCSSTCVIEEDFTCTGGNSNSPDTCNNTKILTAIVSTSEIKPLEV